MLNNPYLSGFYAPVQDEIDVTDLKIIGEIPKDLNGIYMRNGPNPAFPMENYTYPFDGDGMIHAVYLVDGQARYRNRYVETKGLLRERRAGKGLYSGILDPKPMAPEWADPEDGPIAIKNNASIHIIHHAGQYLALYEGSPAYEITAQLKTLGEWQPYNIQEPLSICAHVRHKHGDFFTKQQDESKLFPMLYRTVINLQTGFVKHIQLDDRVIEFPRIKEDRDSFPHQFIYATTKTLNMEVKQGFNALVKYDVKNQCSQVHEFGQNTQINEAVFVPREKAQSEDDGYLMLFVYDSISEQSEFVILDAKNLTDFPLARV